MRLAIKCRWNRPAIVFPVSLSQRSRNCASNETKCVRIKVNNLGRRWRTMSSGSEWFMCHFQLHNYILPSGEPCLDSLIKVWNFPKQVYFTKSLRWFQAVKKKARFIMFPDCFSSRALLFFSALYFKFWFMSWFVWSCKIREPHWCSVCLFSVWIKNLAGLFFSSSPPLCQIMGF